MVACLECRSARTSCTAVANPETLPCDRCFRTKKYCVLPEVSSSRQPSTIIPRSTVSSADDIPYDRTERSPVVPRTSGIACRECRKARNSCSAVANPDQIPCDRCKRSGKECVIAVPTDSERERNKRRISAINPSRAGESVTQRARLDIESPYTSSVSVPGRYPFVKSHETSSSDEPTVGPPTGRGTLPTSAEYGPILNREVGDGVFDRGYEQSLAVKTPGTDHGTVPTAGKGGFKLPSAGTPGTPSISYGPIRNHEVNNSVVGRDVERSLSVREPSIDHGTLPTANGASIETFLRPTPPANPLMPVNHHGMTLAFTGVTRPPTAAIRSLEGIELSGKDVVDLFKHFNELYAPQLPLPILEVPLSPDQYHERSPLLYWSIIAVASRTWPRNILLFGQLSNPVRNLALTSICDRNLDSVQALLLLMTWPLREELANDSILPVAGSMILMARRAGLHRPAHGGDFVRARGILTHRDIVSRTVLWTYCLITYRNICICKGHTLSETFSHDLDGYRRHLPPNLIFKLDVSDCLAEALTDLERYNVEDLPPEKEDDFSRLIDFFVDRMSQIRAAYVQPLSTQDSIFHKCYELLALGLYLYLPIKQDYLDVFNRLAVCASSVAEDIDAYMQEDVRHPGRLPVEMAYSLLMCGTVLLRLLRSELSQSFDEARLETAMYTAISGMERLSQRDYRLAKKAALLMTQLAHSKHVFRNVNGTPSTNLKIRTRIATSSVFDTARWWRDEFETKENIPAHAPYLESAVPIPAGVDTANIVMDDLDNWMFLDYDIPLDMGLAFGDNGMSY